MYSLIIFIMLFHDGNPPRIELSQILGPDTAHTYTTLEECNQRAEKYLSVIRKNIKEKDSVTFKCDKGE